MLAIAGAALAFGILFSPKIFEITPRLRLLLSLLATLTIAFFSEFRNEGKFHFKSLVHFFRPGTLIHDGLNQVVSSLGDFLYRIEYSHWNDFLMGPAIVSVLYAFVFAKIYGAYGNQGSTSLKASSSDESTDLEHALRFARILMNVGLFWFFIQAWAEKAGYLRNPHSSDEIDLPFEFAGTMLGFWMVRVLTKPFGKEPENFRSTLSVDFLASGVIGLLYTLIVGPLTEGVTGAVAHSLYPVVPGSLDVHEYTRLQQHARPFELLVLAGALWWGLNGFSKSEELTKLTGPYEEHGSVVEPDEEAGRNWDALITMAKALGVTTAYLLILATMLSFLEPEGLGWTLVTAMAAVGAATVSMLLLKRVRQRGFLTVFGKSNDNSSS